MSDVEFLPAWYPRRQRNRARLIIGACLTGVILFVAGITWLLS
jgi:hypothetical protein